MHTVRCSGSQGVGVSQHALGRGVCTQWGRGVYPGEGVCPGWMSAQGVFAQRQSVCPGGGGVCTGGCLPGGVCPGRCLPGECLPKEGHICPGGHVCPGAVCLGSVCLGDVCLWVSTQGVSTRGCLPDTTPVNRITDRQG